MGLKRRCNSQVDAYLQTLDESRWRECPMGINARAKKTHPPRTRVQEVVSGQAEQRVFVIDSEERRDYGRAKREQAMERTRVRLLSVPVRVAKGKLVKPEAIGAAAERALREHKGYRYYAWEIRDKAFVFYENRERLEAEKRLEGKYVLATSEKGIDAQEAVAQYKQLTEVERGFRNLKGFLGLRPVYHPVEPRVKAHLLVAALALLVQTLLERRLREAEVNLSAKEALQAVRTVRRVTFRVNGEERSGVSSRNVRAQQVLRALHITQLRPPVPPAGEETVVS